MKKSMKLVRTRTWYQKHRNKVKGSLLLAGIFLGLLIFYMQVRQAQAEPQETWGMADAKEINVNSKVDGRVVKIFVHEGDYVEKGTVIARIDTDTQRTKLIQAQAALQAQYAQVQQAAVIQKSDQGTLAANLKSAQAKSAQAKAALDLAAKDEQRYRTLLKESAISEQTYDTQKGKLDAAQADYDAAQAGVESAEAARLQNEKNKAAEEFTQKQAEALQGSLDSVNLSLDESVIRAPFSGVVTKKYVEEGALISTTVPLFSIQDTNDNWVDFKIKETELGQYKIGDTIKLQGRNEQVRLTGKVESISRKADFATQKATNERGEKDVITFNVKVRTDADEIWPGMRFRIVR